MQFDTTINPLQMNISVSDGDEVHLEVVIVTGTLLPMGQGLMPLPIGIYRIPFPTKASAQEFRDQFSKAIDTMPDDVKKSDLVIADNVQQAAKLAEQIDKFKTK